eukprot:scaffold159463_cov28-Attheya_sp.AAC.1
MLNKDDEEEAEKKCEEEQPTSNFVRNALFGFGAGGIVSGSIAAGIQSGIGNMAAGSLPSKDDDDDDDDDDEHSIIWQECVGMGKS